MRAFHHPDRALHPPQRRMRDLPTAAVRAGGSAVELIGARRDAVPAGSRAAEGRA